jgi:hypothetical protein
VVLMLNFAVIMYEQNNLIVDHYLNYNKQSFDVIQHQILRHEIRNICRRLYRIHGVISEESKKKHPINSNKID